MEKQVLVGLSMKNRNKQLPDMIQFLLWQMSEEKRLRKQLNKIHKELKYELR